MSRWPNHKNIKFYILQWILIFSLHEWAVWLFPLFKCTIAVLSHFAKNCHIALDVFLFTFPRIYVIRSYVFHLVAVAFLRGWLLAWKIDEWNRSVSGAAVANFYMEKKFSKFKQVNILTNSIKFFIYKDKHFAI